MLWRQPWPSTALGSAPVSTGTSQHRHWLSTALGRRWRWLALALGPLALALRFWRWRWLALALALAGAGAGRR